ncbi:MAG: hypothetical protein ACYCWW_00545 [Deltaproteobacteria bacterium]
MDRLSATLAAAALLSGCLLCLPGAPSSSPQPATCQASCTTAQDCVQLTCSCATDGVVYHWQDCTAGCCANCPATKGPILRGEGCSSSCECFSGSCNSGGSCD